MAPRGRSTRSTASRGRRATKPSQRQSSLTFSNSRVTKPSSTKDSKAKAEVEAKAAKLLREQEEVEPAAANEEDEVEDVIVDDDDDEEAEGEQQEEEEQEQEDEKEANTQTHIPIRTQLAKPQPPTKQPVVEEEAGPPLEATAKKISETQIRNYWKAKESERKTPRVHQGELSLYEKVLREFDMSNQYGPCIGITRMKRWNRAQNLGLQPPIEVLAVLLKGSKGGKDDIGGRAYMDGLINSRLGIVAQ